MRSIKIAGREISERQPPYVIAEISGNHQGKIEQAFDLIKAAKAAGADAVKFQAYTPDTITLNMKKPDFIVQDGIWRGRTLYDLYTKAHTPFEWFPELFACAHEADICAFSSVFDYTSLEMLERLGCPAYKVASFEIVDIPLIESINQTSKPIIISTGAASDQEVLEAAATAPGAAFLHCTSEYPADPANANLWRIKHLDHLLAYRHLIGLSDHTQTGIIPCAATALGCSLIEKHLKHGTKKGSEDDEFSLNPKLFALMVEMIGTTWRGLQHSEVKEASRQFRRSLYAVEDITEGEQFTMNNVRSIRPGFGAPPKKLPNLLGKRANKNYRRGDPL